MDKVKILVNKMPNEAQECPFAIKGHHYYCSFKSGEYDNFCVLGFKGHVSDKIPLNCEFLTTRQGTWCGPAVVKEGEFV